MNNPNSAFHDRAAVALRDRTLRTALDRATLRFQELRAHAFADFADADAARDRARLIRAHTLSRLDTYLEQFATNVERAGGQIHFASDAAALNRIVITIARAHQAQSVVKGKSMLSEEVELNHALEAQGIRVLETDLGEYIAQLAGERPSHIVAPIFHKTREQVAALLHEKIGMPLTDDVVAMTAAARRVLRSEFLNADLGISGVNFGVAATGSICLVENEGNGRLTTTAPRVHIALMGIERLVPTLDDLAAMLQVLARSATGQKLSVYTNIITGPRQNSEGDGPDELHVILLDNGRSKTLGSAVAEILYCIRCGACLNACPVYREIGGHAYGSVYSGPVGAVLTPALNGIAAWSELPQASTLCGACRQVCPVRIDIPRLLVMERDAAARAGEMSRGWRWGLRGYAFMATRPALFRLAVWSARLGSRWLGWFNRGWIKKAPPPLNAWTATRDLPAFASQSFRAQWRAHQARSGATSEARK